MFKTAFTGAESDISSFFLKYITVTHFMVVVLHLGLFDLRTKNTTHKERFKTTKRFSLQLIASIGLIEDIAGSRLHAAHLDKLLLN